MRFLSFHVAFAAVASAVIWLAAFSTAQAEWQPGWNGKRHVSYQQQKDLFYNYYAQPGPYNGAAAELYIAPKPVPPHVGHTWFTYQPFYPHEYLYKHQRAYYTYNRGAGWRRTNVRYGVGGLRCQAWKAEWNYPMTNNIWAVHNDVHFPGVRF